jgi:hypothetical protein
MIILLSTAYLPPVQYMTKLLLPGTILLENDENYLKQTYRNRCYIAGPNGPQSLTVPVKKGSFHKIHIREVKVDWSVPWDTLHLRAFSAAYRSSPFYEYYIDDLMKIYRKKPVFLLDLNRLLLEWVMEHTGISARLSYTEKYFTPAADKEVLDYRERIHPKKKEPDALFHPVRYHQVFDDRFGFLENLSIADLLFNEGPDSIGILRRCIRPAGGDQNRKEKVAETR